MKISAGRADKAGGTAIAKDRPSNNYGRDDHGEFTV